MSEDARTSALPQTNGFYDLTGVDAPRFRFQFKSRTADGQEVIAQRDMDCEWLGMQLAVSLPTLFQPAGTNPDGTPRYGFQVVVESFQSGVELPPRLPSMLDVMTTLKRIFNLGDEIGVRGIMLLFAALARDLAGRMEQKKGMPGSPGLLASTPGA